MLFFNNFLPASAQTVLICGHRGGFESPRPENSLSRMRWMAQKCKKQGIMLELDVRASHSGQLYILHDATLERTTTGNGLLINAEDAYLATVFLKDANGNPGKEPIPTFDQVLDWLLETPKVQLMVDVKDDIWEKVVQKIMVRGLEHRCVLLTFNPKHTEKVYKTGQNIRISVLAGSEKDWQEIEALHIPNTQLIAYVNAQTPASLIASLRQKGVGITSDMGEHAKKHPFPFDAADYRQAVQERRCDIFITDFPLAVQKMKIKKV